MGILNVTPDSFSDGGKHPTPDTAIAAGLRMFYAGADIIDVGGESTRPGAEEVGPDEEQRRVLPVIEALVKAGALVSIDTTHAATAAAGLAAGAAVINDVSGLSMEPEMAELVARTKVPYILTHRRGDAGTMDTLTDYRDVAEDVAAELAGVRDKLYAAGVTPQQIIVDPGLGFAKNGGAELGTAAAPGRAGGHGPPDPGRRVPETLPGHPPDRGRQVRRTRGTRRGNRRDHRHQRRPRRLGSPRARRRIQP